MRAAVLLLAILLAVPAALSAAEPKPKADEMVNNPPYAHWSAFKPGTSVTQREVVTLGNGTKLEQKITTKLIKREKDKVVVETTMTGDVLANGKVVESTKTITSFPAKVKMSDVDTSNDASMTVTEGTEEVDVKGKKVSTEWVEAVSKNGDWVVAQKEWTARDVPGGLIKRTITQKRGDTVVSDSVLDLVEYK